MGAPRGIFFNKKIGWSTLPQSLKVPDKYDKGGLKFPTRHLSHLQPRDSHGFWLWLNLLDGSISGMAVSLVRGRRWRRNSAARGSASARSFKAQRTGCSFRRRNRNEIDDST